MDVTVINENSVEVSIDPPETIVIEVDQGKAGRGIVSVTYEPDGSVYYLEITYTDGTTEQVGPIPVDEPATLINYYIKASAAITKGDLVMFTGAVGGSGVLQGAPASASLAEGLLVMGVASETMALNGFGYVTSFGLVSGIDTTGSAVGETWADGDILYYNPNYVGKLTKVRPTSPAEVVVVAAVIKSNAGNGTLFIRVSFYPKFAELSDVYAPAPANNNLISWNSSNNRWQDTNSISVTSVVENGYPVVSQADIGTAPNEIPLNQYLGNLAYQDADSIAGNVGIGGNLTLSSGTANGVAYLNGSKVLTTGSGLTYNGTTFSLTGNAVLGDASTDTVQVNGYMGVGGAPSVNRGLSIINTGLTGATQSGVVSSLTGTSGATSAINGFGAEVQTAAAAFTTAEVRSYLALNPIKGAGSTITNLHGVYVADQTQGTNNYGITSLVSSGTNKWNIYASGTAANYFAGSVGIGVTTPGQELHVQSSAGTESDVRIAGNAGGSGYLDVFHSSSGTGLWSSSTQVMQFGVNAIERLRLSTTEAIFNDPGNDYDFRVESDTNTHALFVDAGNNVVNINSSSLTGGDLNVNDVIRVSGAAPEIKIDVGSGGYYFSLSEEYSGDRAISHLKSVAGASFSGQFQFAANSSAGAFRELFRMDYSTGAVFNESGADLDFRVESDANTHALFVDAGANAVLINQTSNTNGGALSVNGTFSVCGSATGLQSSMSKIGTKQTASISTVATTIFTDVTQGMSSASAGQLLIFGDDNSGNGFMDVVAARPSGTVAVVSSSTLRGSPAARTYTMSTAALQLAMASGTYSTMVRCETLGFPF